MDKILSRNGYSILKKNYSNDEILRHKKNLTIKPHTDKPEYAFNTKSFKIYQETDTRLYMPRYYGIKYFGKPDKNKLKDGLRTNYTNNIILRDYQIPVLDKCVKHLKEKGGGVLSVYCGWGKTKKFLYLIGKLRWKALIIVHTTDLVNQWILRINQSFPDVKVGIIQQNKCEIDDVDIAIAMVHTLSKRDYPKGTFDSFKIVCYDEIHLMCTNMFSKSFAKVACKYTFGLSATPYRDDKCEKVFEYFIGPIIHYEKREPNRNLIVERVLYNIKGFKVETRLVGKRKEEKINYIDTLKNACYNKSRVKFIIDKLIELVKLNKKILVLGEYIEHLELINDLVQKQEYQDFTCGLYIGKMSDLQRKASQDCDIIIGTYKLASVGMDIPDLNTLFLITPRRKIEQSVGRILREVGEMKPMIIDIVDTSYAFKKSDNERLNFYNINGYQVNTIFMNSDNVNQNNKKTIKPKKEEGLIGCCLRNEE